MAKMLGFDISFEFLHYDIPEKDCYIMPSVRSLSGCFASEMNLILERVAKGATLYMSVDTDGVPTGVEKMFGCEFVSREQRITPSKVVMNGDTFTVPSPTKFILNPFDCDVLSREADGNPIFIHHKYGKGDIYFLGFPLEEHLAFLPHAFDRDNQDWLEFYRVFAEKMADARKVRSTDKMVTLTEHTDENNRDWIIAVNNSDKNLPAVFDLSQGRQIKSTIPETIEAHNGIVFEIG